MVTHSVISAKGRWCCGQCGTPVIRGACGPKSAWSIVAGKPIRALRFCSWCPGCGAFGWGAPSPFKFQSTGGAQ